MKATEVGEYFSGRNLGQWGMTPSMLKDRRQPMHVPKWVLFILVSGCLLGVGSAIVSVSELFGSEVDLYDKQEKARARMRQFP